MYVSELVLKNLKIVFKKFFVPTFHKTINKFVKDPTALEFNGAGDTVYCTLGTGRYLYKIVYGVIFIYRHLKFVDRKDISTKDFIASMPKLKVLLLGTYFHEIGHLVFSWMKLKEVLEKLPEVEVDGKKVPAAPYVLQLFNVLEDIVIDEAMRTRYRSVRERRGAYDPNSVGSFLRANRELVLEDSIGKYKDDPINTFNGLLGFLLLKLSFPKKFAGTNTFFSAHPENLDYVLRFLKERKALNRLKIAIEYWNWLLTAGIILPPPGDVDENPFGSPSDKAGPISKPVPSKVGKSLEGELDLDGKSSEVSDDKSDPRDKGVSDSLGDPEEDDSKSESEAISPEDVKDDDIFDELTDRDFDWSIHREVNMNDYNIPVDIKQLETLRAKVSSISEDLASYFLLLKERSKPKYLGYLRSGSSLDVYAVKHGEKMSVFKELIAHKKDKLSGIVLLCDNSGSMDHLKSQLLLLGVLAMSDMMFSLDIPFAVYAYSDQETIMNNSIKVKGFDDNYGDPSIFNHFNILSRNTVGLVSRYLPCPTFHGNRDGYHIEYVSRMLENKPWDNKIVIIFSDGEPIFPADVPLALNRHPNIHYIGIGWAMRLLRSIIKTIKFL
jgi:hypothetical protein